MSDTYPLLLEFNRGTITCSFIIVEIFYTRVFQLPITGKAIHIFLQIFYLETL